MRLLVYGHHSHTGFGLVTEALASRFVAAGIDVRGVAVNHRGEPVRGPLSGRVWPASMYRDGFGHVIHDWFAVGRPVFGHESYYRPQLAGPLWVDGVTSFDLEHRSAEEVTAILRRIREDEDYHLRLCENAAARFREVVDFDADAEAIRKLLESVAS